jgi:hypothetical protein
MNKHLAGHCYECDAPIENGQTVIRDTDISEYFCDKQCYKVFILKNIEEIMDCHSEETEAGE